MHQTWCAEGLLLVEVEGLVGLGGRAGVVATPAWLLQRPAGQHKAVCEHKACGVPLPLPLLGGYFTSYLAPAAVCRAAQSWVHDGVCEVP